MSAVVDLSQINDYYRHSIRCVRVTRLEDLNSMLKHKWVVSVYHYDKGTTIVYYVYYIDTDDA